MNPQPSYHQDLRARRGQTILGFLREQGDWVHREKLIAVAGIDDGSPGPIGRFVIFENVLIALNRDLARVGQVVRRSPVVDRFGRPVELYRFERLA